MGVPQLTKEQYENAVSTARNIAGRLPNGPTAGEFGKAAAGQNHDLLLAIHLIVDHHESNRTKDTAIA